MGRRGEATQREEREQKKEGRILLDGHAGHEKTEKNTDKDRQSGAVQSIMRKQKNLQFKGWEEGGTIGIGAGGKEIGLPLVYQAPRAGWEGRPDHQ